MQSRAATQGVAPQPSMRLACHLLDRSSKSSSIALASKMPTPSTPHVAHPTTSRVHSTSAPNNTAMPAISDVRHELDAAMDAVRVACSLCKRVQLQLSDTEQANKDDNSPVTVADYGAQAIVTWVLQQRFPDVAMVAEEDASELRTDAAMRTRVTQLVNDVLTEHVGRAPDLSTDAVLDLIDRGGSLGGSTGRHWVLDPIDGTRGFVSMRQYAVCLGLLAEGEVVLGVLGCPNLSMSRSLAAVEGGPLTPAQLQAPDMGVLFTATRGAGTYQQPLLPGGPVQPVSVHAGAQGSMRFMESYESRHSNHAFAAAVAREVGVSEDSLRADSQAKYGALARGDAAAFMRFPPPTYREKIWDHCAGSIIVQEAGGVISDASGAPLSFAQGRYLQLDRGIVAAAPDAHAAILRAIQTLDA